LFSGVLDHALEVRDRREHAVDAAGGEVEVVLLRRLVLPDVDHVLEVLLEEVRLRGRRLHADHLALQQRLDLVDRFLRGGKAFRIERIDLALLGSFASGIDFSTANVDGVRPYGCVKAIASLRLSVMFMPAMIASNLPALSAGITPSNALRDDLALGLHPLAQVLGEVDLEADQLAAGIGEVPGLVGPLGRDLDARPVLGWADAPVTKTSKATRAAAQRFWSFMAFPSEVDAVAT
jgi:hypothetical protein